MLELFLAGALSWYAPNDGYNRGELACGGRFTAEQNHIAIRNWRGKCGALALVCAANTGLCAYTRVMDSGPWGATNGVKWEVQVPRLKPGFRRRGVVDLSVALWKKLGKPRFLSPVRIWIYDKTRR